jgi:hypothetical protein
MPTPALRRVVTITEGENTLQRPRAHPQSEDLVPLGSQRPLVGELPLDVSRTGQLNRSEPARPANWQLDAKSHVVSSRGTHDFDVTQLEEDYRDVRSPGGVRSRSRWSSQHTFHSP